MGNGGEQSLCARIGGGIKLLTAALEEIFQKEGDEIVRMAPGPGVKDIRELRYRLRSLDQVVHTGSLRARLPFDFTIH